MENRTLGLYVYRLISLFTFQVIIDSNFVLRNLLVQLNELLDNMKFDHGYTSSSPSIIDVSF